MRLLALLFVVLTIVCLAIAYPSPPNHPPPRILKSDFDLDPAGAYAYAYETEDGIAKDEIGALKSIKNEKGKDELVVVAKGSYSYHDPHGNVVVLTYVADENGFQPQGAHLPTI